MTSLSPALILEELHFAYPGQPQLLHIPRFEVQAGERVFLKGASGSGKSTLLGLVAGILSASEGQITVLNRALTGLSASRRDALRADAIGLIFQMFNLLPYLSVGRNVMLPCQFSKQRAMKAQAVGGSEAEARRLLSRLGLDPEVYWAKRATQLSVGQQQRVAAARALIGRPGLILADEPTSALDTDRRDEFITLLQEECTASGAALLFVSHDGALASQFDRSVDLAELNQALETA